MEATLTKGTACVACPGGPWKRMTVVERYDDGTFKLLPEGMTGMFDAWDSVTRDEISVDDEARWAAAFDALRGASRGLGRDEARRAFAQLGFEVADDRMETLWREGCAKVGAVGEPATVVLDRDQAYRFMLEHGLCARSFVAPEPDPLREFFRLYWNDIRMGGRNPADVGRAIGIDDTLAALGLADAPQHTETLAALAALEATHAFTLPASLKRLWATDGVLAAIYGSHCNNPEPQDVPAWVVRRDESAGWDGPLAVRIMLPHQGEHAWWAVFDDGAADAAIWLSWQEDGGPARRVARSVAFFFWDLSETGRIWEHARTAERG